MSYNVTGDICVGCVAGATFVAAMFPCLFLRSMCRCSSNSSSRWLAPDIIGPHACDPDDVVNVEGVEVIVGICAICSEGVGFVGVGIGIGIGVICGCHTTFADIIVGSSSDTDAESFILTALVVYGVGFSSQPSTQLDRAATP